MTSRQAESASCLWAAETAIATDTSPTSQRPVLCAIATSWRLVSRLHALRDLRHDFLRHPLVGLVLERDHLAAARLASHGALEGRDRPGLLVLDLRDDRDQVEGPVHQPELPPETGGMIATSSPSDNGAVRSAYSWLTA